MTPDRQEDATLAESERKSLQKKIVGGLAWTAAAKWISQMVSWPSTIVAARLLSPGDYGIVEMAGVYFIVANVMAEFGIGMAVLQLRELAADVVAQIATIATLFGLLGVALSFAAAPVLAWFFHAPQLHSVVQVASFTFILTGLESVPLALLQKDLDYRRLSVVESTQALTTALCTIVSAYSGLGYWSLIIGNLGGRSAAVAVLFYWKPTRFHMPNWAQVAQPLKFGMEIATQRIAGSIMSLADSIVVGRTLGQTNVGAYRIATNLAYTPVEKVGTMLMRVTGPLFARIQADKELTARYFLLLTEGLTMILFPLAFGLALVAPDAVHTLLGATKWNATIEPLRWIAVYAGIRALSYLNGQILTAQRQTRWAMRNAVIGFVVMPGAFWIASRWGVGAVALTWLVMSPLNVFAGTFQAVHAVGCGVRAYLNALLPSVAGSASMTVAVLLAKSLPVAASLGPKGHLLIEAGLGAAGYLLVLLIFFRARVMQYFDLLRRLRSGSDAAI